MSLINDALKRARQTSPVDAHDPQPFPALHPVAHPPVPVAGWLIPAIVIFLVVAATFFVGWAVAHNSINTETVAVAPAPAPAAVADAPAPPVIAPAVPPVVKQTPPPPPATPPVLPKLQGIFYSPTTPAAIVNGKTVRPGDPLPPYRVQGITKTTVTLALADGRAITLSLDN